MCKNTCVCALLCVRVRVCVCVCVLFLKKCTQYTKKNQNVMSNLSRKIIASCALILLLGACALIAKAEWGRALILVEIGRAHV